MNIKTMESSVNVCEGFWKDWKKVCKKHKGNELKSLFDSERFNGDGLEDDLKIESIPLLKSIRNYIVNSTNQGIIDQVSDKYDRQPFLTMGWEVRKMRWAIDNSGKRGGLRIIFCLNSGHLLLTFVATKNDCDDERVLEKVFMGRLKVYLNC